MSKISGDLQRVGGLVTQIGEVTTGDRLVIDHMERRPTYRRVRSLMRVRCTSALYGSGRRARSVQTNELITLLDLLLVRSWPTPCSAWSDQPNFCDKSWVTDQYDRYVRGGNLCSRIPGRRRNATNR